MAPQTDKLRDEDSDSFTAGALSQFSSTSLTCITLFNVAETFITAETPSLQFDLIFFRTKC